MPVVAIVSLVITAVIVAALAFYLIRVVLILRHATDTLGKVTFGVRAIALRTEPIGPVLTDVNANLGAVAGALEGIVAKAASLAPSNAP
ncbi:MAG: hypothetical protein NVS3B12_14890 [Acidimicrobiales bacterium]